MVETIKQKLVPNGWLPAVGDSHSDPELMAFLGAQLRRENGQFFMVDSEL